MSLKHVLTFAAAGVAANAGAPVSAQLVADAEAIALVLIDKGYRAEIGTDPVGDPLITTGSQGATWRVYFYGCANGEDCKTVQFAAGWRSDHKISFEEINGWNQENRFGRAYLDGEHDPILKMDIDLEDGGMSPALFGDNIEYWDSALASFQTFMRAADAD